MTKATLSRCGFTLLFSSLMLVGSGPSTASRKQRRARVEGLVSKWNSLGAAVNSPGVSLVKYVLDNLNVEKPTRDAILSSPRAMQALIDIYMTSEHEEGQHTSAGNGNARHTAPHPFDRLTEVMGDPDLATRPDVFLSFAALLKNHPAMPFAVRKHGVLNLQETLLSMAGWAYEIVANGAKWIRDRPGEFIAQFPDNSFGKIVASTYRGEKQPTLERWHKSLTTLGGLRNSPLDTLLWYVDKIPFDLSLVASDLAKEHAIMRTVSTDPLTWPEVSKELAASRFAQEQSYDTRQLMRPSLADYDLAPTTANWLGGTSTRVLDNYLSQADFLENVDLIVSNKTLMRRYGQALEALVRSGKYNGHFFKAIYDLRYRHDLSDTLERSMMSPGGGIQAELMALARFENEGKLVATQRVIDRKVMPAKEASPLIKQTFEIDGVIKDKNGIQILEVKRIGSEGYEFLIAGIERAKQVSALLDFPTYMALSLRTDFASEEVERLKGLLANAIGSAPLRVGYFQGRSDDQIKLLYEPANPPPPIFSLNDPRVRRLLAGMNGHDKSPFLSAKAKQQQRAFHHRLSSNAMKHDIGSVSVFE